MRTRRLLYDPSAVIPSSPFRDFAAGDDDHADRTKDEQDDAPKGALLQSDHEANERERERERICTEGFAHPGARIRARSATRADTEG